MHKILFIRLLIVVSIGLSPFPLIAQTLTGHTNDDLIEQLLNNTTTLITKRIQEATTFYGLASYYENVNYYIVENDTLLALDQNKAVKLSSTQWLTVVGRHNVMLIKAAGLLVRLNESQLTVENPEALTQSNAIVQIATKNELKTIAPELDQIRYTHLWLPLALLSKLIESSLEEIQRHVVSNWGLVIVVFSVLLKLVLLPVGVMTVHLQRRVSQVQAQLSPILTDIKAKYDGEDAHNRLMAAHKDLGVSPFYTLKPMLGSMIQIPILIAVFNALGEMPQLVGQPFLWMDNLAYPDAVGHVAFNIPMFGHTVSLLPFLMTAITLFSTIIFQNRHAPEDELKRQKRNLYLMAAAFFVLFYPFPAAMVLYWALANLLQTVQQQILKL